ncbi:MAG TPA: hypothetical protein VJ761_09720 [Ktedonobacteraceae bacterium]|nr:hypothetical protein [Ktedonobacteraceae bacterium]
MQSFNQQPEEENKPRAVQDVEDNSEMESPPLYEFPADVPQSAPESSELADKEPVQPPSDEDIRRGLVYPPPPSYYQNMQVPPERPPLSQARVANGQPLYSQNNFASAPQLYPGSMQMPGTQAPPFSPPSFPGAQPPVKKSRKWLWIILSIFGVAFLVSCGLCSWAFYNLFNTTFQQVSGAMNVAQSYYNDIQNQDYVDAYKYLQVSNLTLNDFVQQAQASDIKNGAVQSFTVEQPSFTNNPNTGPDLSRWRATVDVTRAQTSYPVLLTVQKIDNAWKITYFDTI